MKTSVDYKTVSFETERLIIRRIKEQDKKAFNKLMSDEKTMYFLGRVLKKNESDGYVESQCNIDYKSYDGNYSIILKDTNEVIGQFGIELSPRHYKAEINYMLISEHWGKGYATEMAKYIVDFLFKECGMNKIEADCVVENEKSLNIFKKIGMKYEGTKKQTRYSTTYEKFFDVVFYGITKEEYFKKN